MTYLGIVLKFFQSNFLVKMKYLFSLALCLFLLIGTVLPAYADKVIVCKNDECTTYVGEDKEGDWTMHIWCKGHEMHTYTGSGGYGGSVCGMTMN